MRDAGQQATHKARSVNRLRQAKRASRDRGRCRARRSGNSRRLRSTGLLLWAVLLHLVAATTALSLGIHLAPTLGTAKRLQLLYESTMRAGSHGRLVLGSARSRKPEHPAQMNRRTTLRPAFKRSVKDNSLPPPSLSRRQYGTVVTVCLNSESH